MQTTLPRQLGWMETGEPVANMSIRERVAERVRVALTAGFRESFTRKVLVNVFDLSTHGFRIETYLGVHEGETVWLTLPGIEAQEAKIVWIRGDYVGCKFVKPLHEVVLQMIAARGPPSPA